MINKLVTNIKNYITQLEKDALYISIHTNFTEYMLPLLEFNIHRNPKCLLVKSENEAWNKCIRLHTGEFQEKTDVKIRVCPAGVEEAVFFLDCGGTVCVSSNEALNEKKLFTYIPPLCRMIEYLKILCPETKQEITTNELVNRAIQFIQRNFYNQISNQDIANACSCSVSTLCHLFKTFKGTSVKQYVCDLRISYAKELLKTSNLSISLIAYKSGFSDYNYFSIKFKKETGLSPSQYRLEKNII